MGSITSTTSNTNGPSSFCARRRPTPAQRSRGTQRSREARAQAGHRARQRGLREAADAESPYALSDRSQPSQWISPRPSPSPSRLHNESADHPTRQGELSSRDTQPSVLGSDGDDQGEPIRLASGEFGCQRHRFTAAQLQPSVPPSRKAHIDQPERIRSVVSARLKFLQLPAVSQLSDLTETTGAPTRLRSPEGRLHRRSKNTATRLQLQPQRLRRSRTGCRSSSPRRTQRRTAATPAIRSANPLRNRSKQLLMRRQPKQNRFAHRGVLVPVHCRQCHAPDRAPTTRAPTN